MLFNSYIFILLFLPVCIVGYFVLNHFGKYTLSQAFLLGMSLWFYGYFNLSYLAIILVSITVNYLAGMLIGKSASMPARKMELITALVFNLGILAYYKYFDFFIENINLMFSTNFSLLRLMLPLGISFFTFQQISYIIDTYRGETVPCSFLQYASFVSFFPQLVAGPIVSHDELIPQFQDESRKHISWENLAKGIYIFVLGLSKKVLIADTFGKVADYGFGNIPNLSAVSAALVILAYTIQIYFDFSGYSDMAIGLGKMLNIDLPINFDSPYKSLTITEFWSKWHRTLTRFLTKYVYIPLGGNRRGTMRTYINVMFVYLLSGLWHGAGWTFVMWGILHGAFAVITRHYKNFFNKLNPVCSWIILFLFLNITWTFFRADGIHDAISILAQAAKFTGGEIAPEILNAFALPEVEYILNLIPGRSITQIFPGMLTAAWYLFVLLAVLGSRNAFERMQTFRYSVGSMMTTAVLLIWCIFSFSGVSTFLYFNF